MQLLAIVLVLFSALCHAAWNFFINYYISLGATYRYSDLSLGYPIARSGVLLIPIWAFLFLGERIALSAGVGIALILVGIYLLNAKATTLAGLLPSKRQLSKGLYMALITAFMMSIYSVIDKAGVIVPGLRSPQLRAFNFLYVMFFASFVFLTPYVGGVAGWEVMKTEVRSRLGIHTLMGLLDLTGYLGLLLAMQLAQVSYALALKQISIVIGAVLGTVFLKEKYGTIRILASLVIVAGCWLISISK